MREWVWDSEGEAGGPVSAYGACRGNNKDATCGETGETEVKTTRCCGLRAKIGAKN